MDPTTFLIILGVAGGLLIGGIVGFFVGKTRSKYKTGETGLLNGLKSQETKPQQASTEKAISDPISLKTEQLRDGYQPLMGVWRELSSNRLVYEIKGKLYHDKTELPVSTLKKLEQIGRDWLFWLGVHIDHENKPSPQEPPEEQNVVDETIPSIEIPTFFSPKPADDVGVQPTERAKRPSFSMLRPDSRTSVISTTRQDSKTKEVPTYSMNIKGASVVKNETNTAPKINQGSIASQIDSILQAKIVDTPFAKKGIRISEDVDNTVIFWIGLDRYKMLDDVKDPEILQLIRSAVAEWDKKTNETHHH